MNGFTEKEAAAYVQSRAFFESIEKTEVTRSYKIVLLLAMIAAEGMPGEIAIDNLVEQVAKLAARYIRIRDDFSVDLSDSKNLRRMLIDNPIRAFVEAQGTSGGPFFRFDADHLSTTFEVDDSGSFRELLREVLDWRLAQYLDRRSPIGEGVDIICRVARAGERPILFLPSNATSLRLEQGPIVVEIDNQAYEAVIAKIAINVVRKPGEATNLLPEILHRWFGEDAGLPGRGERVRLKRSQSGLQVEPLRIATPQGQMTIWGRYSREAIAPAFGLTFSQAIWNAGFVVQDPEVFLLVTLAKDDMNADHRGGDLLITKVGDPPGIASVYPVDEPDAIMTQDVIRLRVDSLLAIPEYLAFFLNSSKGRHLISGITVAATRARFSLRDLKNLTISIPPLENQRSFKIALDALNSASENQVMSNSMIDSLFSSLQSRAFSGQL